MERQSLDTKVAFLAGANAGTLGHARTSLLAHLLGTFELLRSWGARETLCDAGLFHSVYGTEAYLQAALPLTERERVRDTIGIEAEKIVYVFSIMDRRAFHHSLVHEKNVVVHCRETGMPLALEESELADLCQVLLANWLEQRPHLPPERRFKKRPELGAMRRFLPPPAVKAIEGTYSFANPTESGRCIEPKERAAPPSRGGSATMNHIRMTATPWLLLPEADARPWLASTGEAPSFEGGFRKAVSPQMIYLQPETLKQNQYLRNELKKMNRPFPSAEEIQHIWGTIENIATLYELQIEGQHWYLRNRSQTRFEAPFTGRDFRLFIETPNPGPGLPLSGADVVGALSILPLLNGQLTLEQVVDATFGMPVARSFVNYLARTGALELCVPAGVEVRSLPEFLFLGHSSFAVRDGNDLLVVDPVALASNQALAEPRRSLFSILSSASAILISHHHWDHLHFQTLVRLPRDKPFIVPRTRNPSFSNPPIASYLRSLGFTSITECDPWDEVSIGRIRVRFAPFFGESFGLGSHFDALTYYIEFSGKSLYGSVDAWRDDAGDMEETIAEVGRWGPVDYFLFGASGQHHEPAYGAAAPRYFSNELEARADFVRYHPDVSDAERWSRILRPRYLVPYAEFLFDGVQAPDIRCIDLPARAPDTFVDTMRFLTRDVHLQWAMELRNMSKRTDIPLLMLQPMQGLISEAT